MEAFISASLRRILGRVKDLVCVVAVVATGWTVQSCDNDDDTFPVYPLNRPNAIVTIKPVAADGAFYMQLDDSTTLTATNIHVSPYGEREVRAFVNYRLPQSSGQRRQYEVYVNWIDTVLTKHMANDLGAQQNATVCRQDPVEILREWTVAEDGYLTIHFRTQWAPGGAPHAVNLVATDPARPYDLTFYHNAAGCSSGYWGDGVVAFRLDRLPDTGGRTVDMTLHWQSFSAMKSVTFKYCSRRATRNIQGLSYASSGQFEKTLK